MNTTSQHTLIAVFRDSATAQAAVDDLKANGFNASEIYSEGNSANKAHTVRENEQGFVGWFKSMFRDDEDRTDRDRYESALQRGNVVVSVQTDADAADRAVEILNGHSPINIESQDVEIQGGIESRGERIDRFAEPAGYHSGEAIGRDIDPGTGPETIPVVREELQIGKRVVQRGGVRVYARTIEEPVQEEVRLREESVRVERTPVNRQATAADLQPGREQVYEVQEFREEPVVSKQARVVEEVRIAKDATERVDTVRDTVRRTEVNVENLGASNLPDTGRYAAAAEYDNDPAYQFGATAAGDSRYRGRSYDDIENDLRTDYNTRYPGSAWDTAKASVRRGWDKVSTRARGAGA